MHAVNLRNLLGATCRTQREEQNDESDEFLALFGSSLVYIEGARTSSGFYTVEDIEYLTRMYRVSGTQRLNLEPVPLHHASLDSEYVFLLDDGMRIYLWNGARSNPITRSKARLFAEKINKYERKFQADLVQLKQGEETTAFWRVLHGPPPATPPEDDETEAAVADVPRPVDASVVAAFRPKLYKVGIGMGYLELPQVRAATGKLVLMHKLLDTKAVYILDCYTDIFVWIGRRSTRLLRTAALKLSSSLEAIVNRPPYTLVTSTLEGSESQVFKSKFEGWDDAIAVDYTRTAESVSKKNLALNQQKQKQLHAGREGSIDSVVR